MMLSSDINDILSPKFEDDAEIDTWYISKNSGDIYSSRGIISNNINTYSLASINGYCATYKKVWTVEMLVGI
jgi:hypothetical protein